jgi:hypothetical protein
MSLLNWLDRRASISMTKDLYHDALNDLYKARLYGGDVAYFQDKVDHYRNLLMALKVVEGKAK